MTEPLLRLPWEPHNPAEPQPGSHGALEREWLVTNGLGGYASGTVSGRVARRYHGLLIAALPAPFGRTMMLHHVGETVRLSDGTTAELGGQLRDGDDEPCGALHLVEFRLELGLPVWSYEVGACVLEKRLLMPRGQNTVHVCWTLVRGEQPLELRVQPWVSFRKHDGALQPVPLQPYALTIIGNHYELQASGLPALRLEMHCDDASFSVQAAHLRNLHYRVEHAHGYDAVGGLYSPGTFSATLRPGCGATLAASTESREVLAALSARGAAAAELDRRRRLLAGAPASVRSGFPAELVLAADQFIVQPAGRVADAVRAHAAGDELRSVIAGYHWFTDWGRDTMISLEGLTLATGRHVEAGFILRTFAQYVRDGLIPNMFPEGNTEGLYHTADATLWFFHALDRYLEWTGDTALLGRLLPTLAEVVQCHLRGTRFGIGVDPEDRLLRQGQQGYQLTWMDAKVGDYVVTPRRGKAVELNALWYNALRLMEGWVRRQQGEHSAQLYAAEAERVRASFCARFWYPKGQYLLDVVDSEDGDDPACRPNQLFALSLPHPVLDPSRWEPVLRTVQRELLTPVGLRSLSPAHPDYRDRYFGDLFTRDTAYHQGTVWAWLIGPFIDAYLRVYPDRRAEARALLQGFVPHLQEGCVGSLSEIFDASAPYVPRGCIAQAWSVAEVLRSWLKTE